MGVHEVFRADHSGQGWGILRTSPGRTLALAKSLADPEKGGFEVWTPKQTLKRTKQFARTRSDGTKQTIEVDVPIMPSIVFARQCHLAELLAIASAPTSPHPPFSIFRHYDRVPIVADRDLEGMRQEERDTAAALQVLRDCESRAEDRRARAEAARNARARRKALRAERQTVAVGTEVAVREAPAFAGMVGVVEATARGQATVVFNGRFTVTVEAWQLLPSTVIGAHIAA